MSSKFIIAADEQTINKLKEAGLVCISEDESTATFLNNSSLTFDKKGLKFAFTDTLTF